MSTFRRLLGFLQPHRAGAIWSLVLAALAMVGTVAIPWLTGRAIDRVDAGDDEDLRRYALIIAAVALVRLAISVARRLVAGRVSLAIEFDLRNLLYRHLQSLELAFFDRQQTGQLMSRATVDLQSVRFFLGYGLVFISQSALTILLAAVAMFSCTEAENRNGSSSTTAIARRSSRRSSDRTSAPSTSTEPDEGS